RDVTEAHWAVFRRRWEKHTGAPLVLDEDDREDPASGGELTGDATRQKILGYADRFSVMNGETIGFKVSSELPGRYRAELLRLRCGDRGGVGFKVLPVASAIAGSDTAPHKEVAVGSYVEIGAAPAFAAASLSLVALIWPTTPRKGRQAVLGTWDEAGRRGYGIEIDETGALALVIGDGAR